jgi:chaperonin cofactor prefoldin
MFKLIVILFLFLLSGNVFSQKKDVDVSYSLADRERMIRVEVRLDNMEKRMDRLETKLENGNSELRKAMNNLTYSIFGIIGVFIAVLVWDRRKTLYPVLKQLETADERLQEEIQHRKKIDKFLKDLSGKDKKVLEAMKHAGLL